eukprot:m.44001 g.44001  ORF g.44001 m.44001 type:complete len:487 (+) comp19547_c0_seq1:158-1618(+)
MRRFGLKRSALFAFFSLAVFLWVQTNFPKCDSKPYHCKDGRTMRRVGPKCEAPCVTSPTGRLESQVLWNAPMHSWTGTASEAVNFVVPLSDTISNLNLVGGYENEYVRELRLGDSATIETARTKAQMLETLIHSPNYTKLNSTIFVTQYDPGTYAADLRRYEHHNFDYTIGRAMFETTGIPAGWLEQCKLMDEIWIPSHWGRERFIAAGVNEDQAKVVPEAIDIDEFNPRRVSKSPMEGETMLMERPKNKQTFAFLSVFKWEARKNYETLLMAFYQEFVADDNVYLYIRSAKSQDVIERYIKATILPKLEQIENFKPKLTQLVWLPKVSEEVYPSLFAAADAFVLPTHGEGWCRPVMEAMAMELPVITTHWGGLTDLVSENTALLLHPSGLEPAYVDEPGIMNFDDQANHLWASVSVGDLRKVMRYAATPSNKPVIKAIGTRARAFVSSHYARDVVAKLITRRLETIQSLLSSAKNVEMDDQEHQV